jgi:A/G-specific adenine glycosylase
MRREERITAFVDILWSWYARQKRTLPWRDLPDRDPNVRAYKILLSEIMLQQTQVPRVIGAYKRFLMRFPTLNDLAAASNREVVIAWQGMGYNNRALRLRDAARSVLQQHHGAFPQSIEGLMSLPGIGHYTAAAIRNFAFHIATPCIDTNIRRVLHRTFVGPENADGTWKKSDAELMPICADIFAAWQRAGHPPQDFPAAVMDMGSLVQTKRSPRWDICPFTIAGVMKATAKTMPTPDIRIAKKEPGRSIGGRFVPNRIIRGRVIEELRSAPTALTLNELGRRVCIDWDTSQHVPWLRSLLDGLQRDQLLHCRKNAYRLRDE